MDVLGNPVLIFSLLSLIIVLLGLSLFILRARMTLLENKLLESEVSVQSGLNQLHEVVSSSLEASESSTNKYLKILTGKIEGLRGDFSESVRESQMKVEESLSVSGKVLVDQLEGVSNNIATAQSKAHTKLNEVRSELINEVEKSALKQTDIIIGSMNETAVDSKKLVQESTGTILDLIELVRVSNVLTENRNLYDQGRLVLETESFVKIFDKCELTSIEDKETGQVTMNEYHDGKLSLSKTYRTDSLEYVGYYEGGVLKKMEDLTGPEGNNVTQYEYDEAGEVELVI